MTKPEMPEKPLKILKLTAENIKKVKVVEVEPDPGQSVIEIRGNNGEGKTSTIDSIAYGIGGGRLQPPHVIREGQEEARVELDLGDIVVERKWKQGGRGTLEVRNKDGVPQRSPQALLDSLVGRFSFDPVAFLSLKPTEQAEQVRLALGLDFSKLDVERTERFDERTLVNRELDRANARLSALPRPPADEPQPVNTSTLLMQQEELLQQQRERDRLAAEAQQTKGRMDMAAVEYRNVEADIVRLVHEIAVAEETLKKLKEVMKDAEAKKTDIGARGKQLKEAYHAAREKAEQAPDPDLELTSIRGQLEEAERNTEVALKAKEREQLTGEVKKKEAEVNALTKRIDGIDAEKSRMLQAAKFPVDNLEYQSSGLRLNGMPFEQASQAERLRVSVAMGLASNPKLRVLLVREASLLDSKSMALLAQIASEHDAQVWAEVVGTEGKGPCIVIEAGEVAEVRK